MIEQINIEQIRLDAKQAISEASTIEQLENIRVLYLGKKGKITSLLRSLGTFPSEERPKLGALLNQIKDELAQLIASKKEELFKKETKKEFVDVTIPGRKFRLGSLHPITQVIYEIERIFSSIGFSVETGPEIETEYYNFEALNTPEDHPARDVQDSFYINKEKGVLLRTHTSPVQIRVMEKQKPPIRMIAYGRCYRRDAPDATHSPEFYQVEGLAVDTNITFAELKGTLTLFFQAFFGEEIKLRFTPSFFPFTEPSAEVSISCTICSGADPNCRTCKGSGFLEVAGCGMVHPAVFKAVGYDPEKYTGFAFGMGIDRLVMLKYGIDDIRLLYQNDIRFLSQFR